MYIKLTDGKNFANVWQVRGLHNDNGNFVGENLILQRNS